MLFDLFKIAGSVFDLLLVPYQYSFSFLILLGACSEVTFDVTTVVSVIILWVRNILALIYVLLVRLVLFILLIGSTLVVFNFLVPSIIDVNVYFLCIPFLISDIFIFVLMLAKRSCTLSTTRTLRNIEWHVLGLIFLRVITCSIVVVVALRILVFLTFISVIITFMFVVPAIWVLAFLWIFVHFSVSFEVLAVHFTVRCFIYTMGI